LVETGVSRSPTMQRVYQSMAAVSSIRVHRSVIGSIPNTFSRVVSRITYSPGRVGCNFPYGRFGRVAMSRLRAVVPVNVRCWASSRLSSR
jgi:hypothetical protein